MYAPGLVPIIQFSYWLFNGKFKVGKNQYVRKISSLPIEQRFEMLGKLNARTQPGTLKKFFFSFIYEDELRDFHRDLRVTAQLGAEHLAYTEDFSGSLYKEAVKPIIKSLDPTSIARTLLQKGERWQCEWYKPILFKENKILNLAKKETVAFINEIDKGKAGEEWVIPCALRCEETSDAPGGHAIVLHVKKEEGNRYTLHVFNEGYGLVYHSRLKKKNKYQSFIEVKNIERDNLALFYACTKVLAAGKWHQNMPGIETFYKLLLPLTLGIISNGLEDDFQRKRCFTTGQNGGSCSASSLLSFLRYTLQSDPNDTQNYAYKEFKTNMRFNLLLKTFRMIRWGADTDHNRLVCREIIDKLKKRYPLDGIPSQIVKCEKELDKLEGKGRLYRLTQKVYAIFEKIRAWFKIRRLYTLTPHLEQLFTERDKIISKDRNAIEDLYRNLAYMGLEAQDHEKFIAISEHILTLIKENYSVSKRDTDLAAGICALIYRNSLDIPHEGHERLKKIQHDCALQLRLCRNILEGGTGPWKDYINGHDWRSANHAQEVREPFISLGGIQSTTDLRAENVKATEEYLNLKNQFETKVKKAFPSFCFDKMSTDINAKC